MILNIMGLWGYFGTFVMIVVKALGTHWERTGNALGITRGPYRVEYMRDQICVHPTWLRACCFN